MNNTRTKEFQFNQYRLALLVAGIAYPLFGIISEVFVKMTADSFLTRLPYGLLAISLWYLSGKINFFKKNIRILMLPILIGASYQYFNFFVDSNYHFYFSMGLIGMNLTVFTMLLNLSDIAIYIVGTFLLNFKFLKEMNEIFLIVYIMLIALALVIYILVIRLRNSLVEEMQMSEEKLQSLNKIATQAAHDIRSPLLALDVVLEKIDLKSENKKIVKDSVSRIQYIAETLLNSYRKEFSQVTEEAVDLAVIVNQILNEKRTVYIGIEFVLAKKEKSFQISKTIALEVSRIISNLLQNSIESIDHRTGRVDISLSVEARLLQISIMDNGCGIPLEYQNKIFERGLSLNKKQGTGLGLAHAKEYIESIGGTIELTSKVGKGTLVTLRIPTSAGC